MLFSVKFLPPWREVSISNARMLVCNWAFYCVIKASALAVCSWHFVTWPSIDVTKFYGKRNFTSVPSRSLASFLPCLVFQKKKPTLGQIIICHDFCTVYIQPNHQPDILSFTAKLPYSQLVMWQEYFQQKCMWQRYLQQRRLWLKIPGTW